MKSKFTDRAKSFGATIGRRRGMGAKAGADETRADGGDGASHWLALETGADGRAERDGTNMAEHLERDILAVEDCKPDAAEECIFVSRVLARAGYDATDVFASGGANEADGFGRNGSRAVKELSRGAYEAANTGEERGGRHNNDETDGGARKMHKKQTRRERRSIDGRRITAKLPDGFSNGKRKTIQARTGKQFEAVIREQSGILRALGDALREINAAQRLTNERLDKMDERYYRIAKRCAAGIGRLSRRDRRCRH